MLRAATSPVQISCQPRKTETTRTATQSAPCAIITAHQKFMLSLNAAELASLPHRENQQLQVHLVKMLELKTYIQSLECIYAYTLDLQRLETQNRPSLAYGDYKTLIKQISTQTKTLFPQDEKKDEKLAFQRLSTSLTDMRNPATKSQITYCLREFQVMYEKLVNNPALAETIQKTVEDITIICASLPMPQSITSIPISFRRGLPGKEFKPRVITPVQSEANLNTQQDSINYALSPSPRTFPS